MFHTPNKINGHCFTNIDDVRCFVTVFAEVPKKDDSVMVFWKGNKVPMKVVHVTHDIVEEQPYIIVELWQQSFIRYKD